MNKLFLITNKFPYGKDTGEMYLNYEIKYLCQKFDEVNIISCTGQEMDGMNIKELPKNLNISLLGDNRSKYYYIFKSFGLFFKKKDKEVKEELKNISLPKKIFLMSFIARAKYRYKKIIDMNIINNIDVNDNIYIYSYRLFDFAYISIKLKEKYFSKNKTKMICRAHRYDLYEEENKFNYLPLRKYLLENIDLVYPCSINGEKYLIEKFPPYKSKIKCMYLGSEDFGKKLSKKNNDRITLLSCSNINNVKRVDFIADVIEDISKKVDVCWTHIGGNENEIKAIKTKHSNLVNEGKIIFKGAYKHIDVMNYLKNNDIDLFINLSTSEGVSQSIMEAISFGIPCIATNVGGTSEIVVDNVSGFLVNLSDSHTDVAKVILDYNKRNSVDKNKLRKSTRKYWEDNFNSDNNIKKFIQEVNK